MSRVVKHFDLHQVADTELRVVSDVESGVLEVIQAEDAVIRGYVESGLWRHGWVDLFVLQDLQALAGQLSGAGGLPPGGLPALDLRPVVNAYDLADLSGCHVFVNQKVMLKEGYWGDPTSIRALLAHEHAHPLSENETTRASRGLRLRTVAAPQAGTTTAAAPPPVDALVAVLAEKLCCYAPREIFANDLTITGGFAEDLFHLDRRVVAAAARGVFARRGLVSHLQGEADQGRLTTEEAALLLLVGDLKGYLDLALETAPFYRTGRPEQAMRLEAVLLKEVFPRLEPQVQGVYLDLKSLYLELRPDLTVAALISWGRRVIECLVEALRERGMESGLSLDGSEEREEKHA